MTAAAALLASVAWGVADFLGGLKSRVVPTIVVLLLAQVAGVLAAGVPWAIAAVIGFGGYYVPMHAASDEDFLWPALVFRSTVGLLAFAAWLVVRPPLAPALGHLRAIATIGILDTVGNALFAAASSLGEVSVVSVLATLYPVTTVALAAAVLGERLDRLQFAGVGSALAGVVLISAA